MAKRDCKSCELDFDKSVVEHLSNKVLKLEESLKNSMKSIQVCFKADNGDNCSIPLSDIKDIYGAMDDLQSVTVIRKNNNEKIVLHWNRSIIFSQDGA